MVCVSVHPVIVDQNAKKHARKGNSGKIVYKHVTVRMVLNVRPKLASAFALRAGKISNAIDLAKRITMEKIVVEYATARIMHHAIQKMGHVLVRLGSLAKNVSINVTLEHLDTAVNSNAIVILIIQ